MVNQSGAFSYFPCQEISLTRWIDMGHPNYARALRAKIPPTPQDRPNEPGAQVDGGRGKDKYRPAARNGPAPSTSSSRHNANLHPTVATLFEEAAPVQPGTDDAPPATPEGSLFNMPFARRPSTSSFPSRAQPPAPVTVLPTVEEEQTPPTQTAQSADDQLYHQLYRVAARIQSTNQAEERRRRLDKEADMRAQYYAYWHALYHPSQHQATYTLFSPPLLDTFCEHVHGTSPPPWMSGMDCPPVPHTHDIVTTTKICGTEEVAEIVTRTSYACVGKNP